MNSDEMTTTSYLQELYNSTQGDPEATVSMHDIGLILGLDKAESGRIAEELMVTGEVELKTLAGGIGITNAGLNALGLSPQSNGQEPLLQLSTGPVITEDDQKVIEQILSNIKNEVSSSTGDYPALEQIVLDIKVLEIHILSPSPKTAVCIALFHSLAHSFSDNTSFINDSGLAAVTA